MSTIIIIGGGTRPTENKIVDTAEGAEIRDDNGLTVATFSGPEAHENAIKYLKVMKG